MEAPMLKISKKVEYGLMAILHMDSMGRRDVVAAREISALYNIPPDLLGKVMQALAKAGLIESVHGAQGGYLLSRPLDRITLGDVFEAVEGPLHLVKCYEEPACCEQYEMCNIRDPVMRIQDRVIDYISRVNLAEFRRPEKSGQGVMT